jgi:hypothetical protein
MDQRARHPRRAQNVPTPTVRIKEAALTEREAKEEEASAAAVAAAGIFKR